MKLLYTATTGFMPPKARPQAKVTACCSAMPTSKNLSGHFSANFESPVPSGMAAVMATREGSLSAAAVIHLEKADVKELPPFFADAPLTPWCDLGWHSAGSNPLPFLVTTWRSTGPLSLLILSSTPVRAARSWPGMGPK